MFGVCFLDGVEVRFGLDFSTPCSGSPSSCSFSSPACSRADAFGAAQTGRIAGSVEDPTGGRIANAAVSLAGPVDRTATTDADGRFAFGDLPDGEYRLRVGPDGFAPTEQRVQLSNGATVSVAFKLVVRVDERIVVTASKTGERELQSTPLAVSVLSGEELRRSESRTVEDLAGQSPSLTFSQNTGFAQLTIRGIGTNAVFAGSDPSSAVYVDGVYLARPAMVLADFLDLERVEVLRGPQGTLYGRNAVGGALNVITKLPTTRFEASAAERAAGNLQALRAEASVSGPIVAGRLTASAAVLRGVEDGFVRDLEHPDHPLGGEDVTGGARQAASRAGAARVDLLALGRRDAPGPDAADLRRRCSPSSRASRSTTRRTSRGPHLHRSQESRNLQYGTAARLAVRLAPQTTAHQPDGVPEAGLRRPRRHRHHRAGARSRRDLHEIQHQWSEELTSRGAQPGCSWVGGLFLFGGRRPTSRRRSASAARAS